MFMNGWSLDKMKVDVEIDLDDVDGDSIKEYCKNNLTIDDVYDDREIIDYCEKTFDVDDIFDSKKISEAATKYDPEDIFPESVLADWANRNGWRGPN